MPWGDGGLSTPASGAGGGWGSGGLTGASAPPPKKKSGGGFLHDILHNPVTHAVGQTVTDLKNAAVNAPSGAYHILDTGVYQPWKDVVTTGHVSGKHNADIDKLTKATIDSTASTIAHPLRHPGDTLLLALPGVNAAGKAAEVGSLVRAGKSSEALQALTSKRVPPARITHAKGVTARLGSYSQSPATRLAQRYIDQLRQQFPDARLGVKTHTQRVGDALQRQRSTDFKVATAPASGLKYAGRSIRQNSPEGMAIRSVAEGTPLDAMQATWRADLAKQQLSGFKRNATAVRNLKRQIAIAEKAKPLVTADEAGKLSIADPKLAALYERTAGVAKATDETILSHDLMAPETVAGSISKPGQQYGLGEDFAGGQFHVGYERRTKPFSQTREGKVGSANTLGIPNKPGRFKQSTWTNLHEGAFRNDVPSLVADNAVETERYAALLRARQFFIDHAQDSPEGMRNPVAVRTDEIGRQPFDRVIKDFQDQQRQVRRARDHSFNPMGVGYDATREHIFPEVDSGDFVAHPEVKWIEEPLLGGLNKPSPLAAATQFRSVRGALRLTDAINNAQKFALLYLKPAYITPNVVGNAFLNLVQQGWASPLNLTRAVRLAHKLPPEDYALIRDLMGEGISGSLESRAGATSRLNNFASQKVFSPIVDTPFRLASFLYEARRELGIRGASTDWRKVSSLLHDEAKRPQLHDVVTRANKAIIDYGDLTPVEQAFVRRILFFYPWLKGSTKYAGHFLAEHPNQAAAAQVVGAQGQQFSQQGLGNVPSWAEGYFKVGGSDAFPLIVNPTSAGILSQPGQLAEAVNQFVGSGNPQAAYQLSGNLTPFLGAVVATLSGKDSFTGKNLPQNLDTFVHQFAQGIPAKTLYDRLTQDQTFKTFPLSTKQAVLQFLFGGVAPKSANKAKLNSAYTRERQPLRP